MSEMVERVSRRVFVREYENTAEHYDRMAQIVDTVGLHSGDCTNESHTCIVCQITEVRAAARDYITAMREPTLPMVMAAGYLAHDEAWRAMIDEALK